MLFCHKIVTHTSDYFYANKTNYLFKNKTIEIFPFIKALSIENNNIKVIQESAIPIFGFLGRICEEKGIEVIIKSSKILKNKNINHRIIIAGDLEDKRFKKYINKVINLSKNSKSIQFIGKLSEIQKSEFFEKINILLLPSTNSFEAFGIVQIEAMNFGNLVIASALNGVKIPVSLTKNGLICKINDHEDLAIKMIELIKTGKSKNKIEVINSCNKIFDYSESEKKYLELFSS